MCYPPRIPIGSPTGFFLMVIAIFYIQIQVLNLASYVLCLNISAPSSMLFRTSSALPLVTFCLDTKSNQKNQEDPILPPACPPHARRIFSPRAFLMKFCLPMVLYGCPGDFRQKQRRFDFRIFSHRCAHCDYRCVRCENKAYLKRVFRLFLNT
jgi:hypothetical protein